MTFQAWSFQLLKVLGSQIVVGLLAAQDMIDNGNTLLADTMLFTCWQNPFTSHSKHERAYGMVGVALESREGEMDSMAERAPVERVRARELGLSMLLPMWRVCAWDTLHWCAVQARWYEE
jgi:hypothetical protein